MNKPLSVELTRTPAPVLRELQDPARDHAIESCIASLDLLAKTVVDLRGGLGITAMLFAKYGAMRVFTLIPDPVAARHARELLRRNGYETVVTVLQKTVLQAQKDEDLPEVADILFAEELECGVYGEDSLSLFQDIAALSGPQTLVLPESVLQTGVMVCDDVTWRACSFDTAGGLDLSRLNRMSSRTYVPMRTAQGAGQATPMTLSPRILCRRYDYRTTDCLEDRVLDVVAMTHGVCHGLLTWFDARYGQAIICNRRPDSLWPPAFHPLPSPIDVKRGQRYRFQLSGDGRLDFLCDTPEPTRHEV